MMFPARTDRIKVIQKPTLLGKIAREMSIQGILGTDTLPHVGIHFLRTNYIGA
jgi:hypothetical protein